MQETLPDHHSKLPEELRKAIFGNQVIQTHPYGASLSIVANAVKMRNRESLDRGSSSTTLPIAADTATPPLMLMMQQVLTQMMGRSISDGSRPDGSRRSMPRCETMNGDMGELVFKDDKPAGEVVVGGSSTRDHMVPDGSPRTNHDVSRRGSPKMSVGAAADAVKEVLGKMHRSAKADDTDDNNVNNDESDDDDVASSKPQTGSSKPKGQKKQKKKPAAKAKPITKVKVKETTAMKKKTVAAIEAFIVAVEASRQQVRCRYASGTSFSKKYGGSHGSLESVKAKVAELAKKGYKK